MPPVPTAERPPTGLDAYWLGVWRHALKALKEQGTWKAEQKPLLDEYVFALRAAEATRDGFAWLEKLEDVASRDEVDWQVLGQIANALPTQWDRHVKRAEKLAQTLLLTPESQSRHANSDSDEEKDPFAEFDRLRAVS
jgi:hypothetical protein